MRKIDYWEKFEEESIYHLYNRGINGTTIFRIDENYQFFLKKWEVLILPYFETLAYCLMPNHIHFFNKSKTAYRQIDKSDFY